MLFSGLSFPLILSRLVTLLIALTVHEFSHAFVADRFGDPLPRYMGRLTLNPIRHLDVVGSLLLLISGFGWAKPVPVSGDLLRRRSRASLMLVSAAGPLSNLALAALAAIPVRLGMIPNVQLGNLLPTPAELIIIFILTNLGLMIFNLIPIAPLDGEEVARYFFPASWQPVFDKIQRNGPVILIVVLFLLPYPGLDIFGFILRPISRFLFGLLTGVQI